MNVEDIVLSREAMESLRFVSDLDDRKKATVSLVSSTVLHPYYSKSSSPVASPMVGKSLSPRIRPVESPRPAVRVYVPAGSSPAGRSSSLRL